MEGHTIIKSKNGNNGSFHLNQLKDLILISMSCNWFNFKELMDKAGQFPFCF